MRKTCPSKGYRVNAYSSALYSLGINIESSVGDKLVLIQETLRDITNQERVKISTCCCCVRIRHHVVEGGGCGANVFTPYFCKSKWCARCYSLWANESIDRVEEVLSKFKNMVFITLSIRSVKAGNLANGWLTLDRCLAKLKTSVLWKKSVALAGKSWVAGRGLTYKNGFWHMHWHIVVDAIKYIPDQYLKGKWVNICGDSAEETGVNIQKGFNPAGLAREIILGTGGKDHSEIVKAVNKDDVLMGELIGAMSHLKWFTSGRGIGMRKRVRRPCYCPGCGQRYDYHEFSDGTLAKEDYAKMLNDKTTQNTCYRGFLHDSGPPWEMQSTG